MTLSATIHQRPALYSYQRQPGSGSNTAFQKAVKGQQFSGWGGGGKVTTPLKGRFDIKNGGPLLLSLLHLSVTASVFQ
jgi:hypothetical protein